MPNFCGHGSLWISRYPMAIVRSMGTGVTGPISTSLSLNLVKQSGGPRCKQFKNILGQKTLVQLSLLFLLLTAQLTSLLIKTLD